MKEKLFFVFKILFIFLISTKTYASLDYGTYSCQQEVIDGHSEYFALEYTPDYFAVHSITYANYDDEKKQKFISLKKLYLIDTKNPIQPGWSTGSKSTLYKINAIESNLFSFTTHNEVGETYYSNEYAKQTTENTNFFSQLDEERYLYETKSLSTFIGQTSRSSLGETTEIFLALCFKMDASEFKRK